MISCFAEKDLMMDFNYFHYLGNEQYISTSLVQKITSSGMLIYVKTNKTKTQGPGGQASFCISNFHGQKLIIWVPQKNVSSLPRVFKYIATSIWKAIKYNDTKSFGVHYIQLFYKKTIFVSVCIIFWFCHKFSSIKHAQYSRYCVMVFPSKCRATYLHFLPR